MLLKVLSVFVSLSLFAVTQISAQRINVPTTISTPRGNVKINTPMNLPQYHYYGQQSVNRKHNFTIVFLNDSTITVKTRINIDDSVHTLKLRKEETQTVITPLQTKEIYRIDDSGTKIIGKPMGTCWIFKADSGKINTYSVTSDIDAPTIAYIQKGNDGTIVPLNQEKVSEMVKDNEKALKLAERKKLLKAIDSYNKD